MSILLAFVFFSSCFAFDIQTRVDYTITVVFRASLMKWYELAIPVSHVGYHHTFPTQLALGVCSLSTTNESSFSLTIHRISSPYKHILWHLLNNVKPVVFFDPENTNSSFICCRIDWVPFDLKKEGQFDLKPKFPTGPCPWQITGGEPQMLDWYTADTSVKYYITKDSTYTEHYRCRFLSIWPK